MTENKNREEFVREVQRAFMEGYAVDMDNWSALRDEQESWCGRESAIGGEVAKLERPKI
jgi:hypothetical protein